MYDDHFFLFFAFVAALAFVFFTLVWTGSEPNISISSSLTASAATLRLPEDRCFKDNEVVVTPSASIISLAVELDRLWNKPCDGLCRIDAVDPRADERDMDEDGDALGVIRLSLEVLGLPEIPPTS